MMNMVWNKKKKGFTLIELIVVIAIIGILAAIAIPRLAGFTAQGKKSAVTAESRTILTAFTTLVAETPDVTLLNDGTDILALTGPLKGVITGATNDAGSIDFVYTLNGWAVTCANGVLGDPAAAAAAP